MEEIVGTEALQWEWREVHGQDEGLRDCDGVEVVSRGWLIWP